jgi:phosphoserine aminotransferase
MSRPIYTFSAGPCIFPLEVLYSARDQLPSFFNMAEDSEKFKKMEQDCKDLTRELLKVPDNYEIFYMQGGATTQFVAVVQNFLGKQGNSAEYIVTGTWSLKAANECKTMGGKAIQIRSEEAKVISY